MGDKAPQLRMIRPHLLHLPQLELPEPYHLTHWQLGWEEHWTRIIASSFGATREQYAFDRVMRIDTAFAPERILFLCHEDEPVATASAWYNPSYRREVGILHYVGVLPEHQGKRLGYAICLAALHRMVQERRVRASLLTDDFRLAAIKTYLRLGFVPEVAGDASFAQRWQALFKHIGQPELAKRFLR